jgi:hypothetical protein
MAGSGSGRPSYTHIHTRACTHSYARARTHTHTQGVKGQGAAIGNSVLWRGDRWCMEALEGEEGTEGEDGWREGGREGEIGAIAQFISDKPLGKDLG